MRLYFIDEKEDKLVGGVRDLINITKLEMCKQITSSTNINISQNTFISSKVTFHKCEREKQV